MRTLPIVTVATAALLLAACGTPEPPQDESSGQATAGEQLATDGAEDHVEQATDGTTALDLGDHCENPQDGYRIRYPQAWYANDGQVTAPCRVFDVEVPEIEPNTVLPLSASALVTLAERRFDEMPALIEDDPATEVHALTESEINGRAVLRVDGVATGEAYLPEGIEVHRTYVAFGDRTLVASINDLGEPHLDLRRELIADMLATLEMIDRTQDGDRTRHGDHTEHGDRIEDGTDGDTGDGSDDTRDESPEDRAGAPLIGEPSREPRAGGAGSGYLVDVRLGHHGGFTRLVLEFEESVPEYEVSPTEGPIMAHPSGKDLELSGGTYLEVITTGTSVDLTGDEATRTYDGPDRFDSDGDPVVEVALSGDHHGVMSWVLGLSEESDFAVAELQDPARIVIDVIDEG